MTNMTNMTNMANMTNMIKRTRTEAQGEKTNKELALAFYNEMYG
jgi:hypothetical protein